MIKLKLSHFEKVAGLFVLGGISLILITWVAAALKQGWLESKVTFVAKFPSGEGLYPGLDVLLSGIRIGSVEKVELLESNQILVQLSILEKYQERIRKDSKVMLIRPLILGERAVEVSMGDNNQEVLPVGSEIPSRATFDVMTLLSGRMVNDSLTNLSTTMGNLMDVLVVLLEKDKLESFVRTIDRIEPLVKNLDQMSIEVSKLSKQINKNDNAGKLVQDLSQVSQELNKMLPDLKVRAPKLADNFEVLVNNMAVLSEQFKVIGPAIAEIGPELPAASRKALEALDETVVLLKALQQSFVLKSHVDEIRAQEAQPKSRIPAEQSIKP